MTTPTRIAALLTLLLTSATAHAKVYHLYYLGGQSNMDGYGRNADLTDDQRGPVDNTRIFEATNQNDGDTPKGLGLWSPLTPGHGRGFTSDGTKNTLSECFGPELSFARRMHELHPERNIAIIKFSRGGSTIAVSERPSWHPNDQRIISGNTGTNQYDFALKAIDNATNIHDIDNDGEPDTLIPSGIVWMQGESDAQTPEMASAYLDNLTLLMELFRAALRADELPVVIGLISDSKVKAKTGRVWTHGDIIQTAQRDFCDHDPRAALVESTLTYDYSDNAHYDSSAYLDLGARFAEAMSDLEDDQPVQPSEEPRSRDN